MGIEAVKWAWILIKFGTEKAVIKYREWFTTLVRKNNSRLPQIKTLWERFAIATRTRQSETFSVIAEEIAQDLTTVNDALTQSPKKKPRNDHEQQRWRNLKGYPGKGKGNKGKGKGGGKTWQWQQQPWTATWQSRKDPGADHAQQQQSPRDLSAQARGSRDTPRHRPCQQLHTQRVHRALQLLRWHRSSQPCLAVVGRSTSAHHQLGDRSGVHIRAGRTLRPHTHGRRRQLRHREPGGYAVGQPRPRHTNQPLDHRKTTLSRFFQHQIQPRRRIRHHGTSLPTIRGHHTADQTGATAIAHPRPHRECCSTITTPLCFEMGGGGEALKYFRAHFFGGRD